MNSLSVPVPWVGSVECVVVVSLVCLLSLCFIWWQRWERVVPQVSVAKGGHYQVRLPEFDGSNISVAKLQRRVLAAK